MLSYSELYDLGYTQAEADSIQDAKDEAAHMADDSDPDYEGDEE